MLIGQGAHNRTDRQTVEVVVNEDENAKRKGGKRGTNLGVHVRLCPLTEGLRTACAVHQSDHDTEDHKEDKDTCGIGNRRDKAIVDDVIKRAGKRVVGGEERTKNDTDKQGRINLLGDQGKSNRHDRRNQRHKGGIVHAGGNNLTGALAIGTVTARTLAGTALNKRFGGKEDAQQYNGDQHRGHHRKLDDPFL